MIASSAVSRPPASAVDPDRLPSAVIENTKPHRKPLTLTHSSPTIAATARAAKRIA